MATTTDYLTQLQNDKQTLVNNLVEKGVEATMNETFTSLVPKVLDISSGGAEITKGFRIDNFNESGQATEISIIGMTEVPNHYFQYASYRATSWFTGDEVFFSPNTTKIGEFTFSDNANLKLKALPDSITELGDSCFRNCTNLPLESLPSGVTIIDDYAFNSCKNLKLTTIPDKVTTIGMFAFAYTNLTELDITSQVITKLGSNCFTNSSNLSKLIMRKTTPPTAQSSFLSGTAIAKGNGFIYVPDESIDAYKTASQWSTYANYIKGISELA